MKAENKNFSENTKKGYLLVRFQICMYCGEKSTEVPEKTLKTIINT